MSDGAVGLLALAIAGGHAALFVVAWVWVHRRGHLGFLVLLVPATVAWSLAGYPLVRILTFGTRPLQSPRTGLQTAGLIAIIAGFATFFVCAIGSLVSMIVSAPGRRGQRGR